MTHFRRGLADEDTGRRSFSIRTLVAALGLLATRQLTVHKLRRGSTAPAGDAEWLTAVVN
jgi:hypothetical protein